MLRYAVATPARNEEGNLPRLAAALAAQTHPPTEWIVVDDGSTDATPEILAALTAEHPWIRRLARTEADATALNAGRRQARDLDGFRRGVNALTEPVDVVIKVDADVSFEPDFGERLMAGFEADADLALASGTCYEQESGEWVRRTKADTTVWGATRAYRWDVVDILMGLEPFMGWDGLDEIQVQLRGLRTTTFVDLPFRHHRPEGGRELTSLHQGEALGRASYYMGYRPSYLALRAFYRARREPAALAMLWGYAAAAARRDRRCPDAAVVRTLRDRQRLGVALRRGAPAS
jgi:glycosyltransferase involved in cell wall biosynthesis